MKLWNKNDPLDQGIERFTVGKDPSLDQHLVYYDCQASIAHAQMLQKIGIIDAEECRQLVSALNGIIDLHRQGKFEIKQSDEDCHTAIENYLTLHCGEAGKKIHTARSRNDQVLTALRLFEKNALSEIKQCLGEFRTALTQLAQQYPDLEIPGYTHMQKAMPMKVATWLASFKDAAADNETLLDVIYTIIDQNPLGTAAGFGTSIAIDRVMTQQALSFARVQENPLYAQLSRGKFEGSILHLCSQITFDLNKLATDLILFSMAEFKFLSLPMAFCTGSSIMPQKKNPDVLELLRAHYHEIIGEEFKVKSMAGNLISGYNRDMQLSKEPLINGVTVTLNCIKIATQILPEIVFNQAICGKAMTAELYATEEANQLVATGVPFREAYKIVAKKFRSS